MKDLKFTRAFEKLKEMGFSNYESLVYLKLVLHSPSTAKEISESTGIPYTKVYNILENLALKGWIEIGHGRPMQFKAKPPLEVIEIIKSEYKNRINKIEDIFINELQPIYDTKSAESSEVWFIKSQLGIVNRIRNMFSSFKKELHGVIGYLDMSIYSGIIDLLSNIDNKKLVKLIINEKAFPTFNKINSSNILIKKGENVIPFNVILSDKGEILFHLVVGLDRPQDEHKNFAVYIFDKSLAKIIYEYFEYLWRSMN
ncbi:MAG: helix-turn-helix domain-containing protein [Candidatus Methanomethylicaceae archaeon]